MSTSTMARHRWLGYEEAATRLGVSKRQLQRWVSQKRIEHTHLGNRTLFTPEALDDFVAANTTPVRGER